MTQRSPFNKQRGFALWVVLLTLIMAGTFAFYRNANLQLNRPQQQTSLSLTLAQAKDALIAYAVTDSERPGSLPCPDLITDSAGWKNYPNDGLTDVFTTNNCPSNIGWLPWVTLDLPELTDDTGTRLWYVLAPGFRNHISAHPINSDTPTGLTADLSSDVAALIIAPRGALNGQNRPSNTPSDYLDGENGNGNDNIFVTGPQSDTFNDVVLVITRQELMAAVEKRVANEVRSCLSQHAASNANTDHRFPWPAPISNIAFQGNTNSLFGRIPSTQPSSGLNADLNKSITKLTESIQLVNIAGDANQQLTALNNLAQNLTEAKNLFDAVYTAYNKIKQIAETTQTQMSAIQNAVTIAGTRISRSEGSTIRTSSDAAASTLTSLKQQLTESGIDVFPWELQRLNTSLVPTGNTTNLLSSIQAIESLLAATSTPRTDISLYLTPATTAATIAVAAVKAAIAIPSDNDLLLAAQAAANALKTANSQLITSVQSTRVNVLSGHISDATKPLDSLASTLRATPSSENSTLLLAALNTTKKSITSIITGVPSITSAQSSSLISLQNAINTATLTPGNYTQINSETLAAITVINSLASAIATNEAVDNNVSKTSLNAAISSFQNAQTNFSTIDTATPRLVQRLITPYAQALSNATVDINIWAKSIIENANTVAPLAKAAPVASNVQLSDVNALDSSAYKAAQNTLSSITDKNAASDLLQSYINNPTTTNQNAAMAALATTTAMASNLINQSNALNNDLATTTASATPMIWLSSRCDFLLSSASTWWSNNQWVNTLFYQMSSPLSTLPGNLTVNGQGTYQLVTLAAGRALSGQTRSTLTTSNFLEGINAEISRDGNALTPATGFSAAPSTSTFNDRLAY